MENGIDPSMFTLTNQKRDIDITGAGSLSFLKQYDIFLEIIAGLKNKLPNIKAVLCGDGEHRDGLKQMREEVSLQQNVELAGMKTPAETISLMQRSKIFLHPSSYEGFSTACLEALYGGLHVISFVKPMHHEIKNWHIVKTKDEMLQKTFELLSNDKTIYEPVLVNTMDDSARKMIELFGFND
jgi:glycosyltransferase involved in cell wall biosynthesis